MGELVGDVGELEGCPDGVDEGIDVGYGLHSELPTPEVVPSSHLKHMERPDISANSFSLHIVHSFAAESSLYLPAEHCAQSLPCSEYLPASQFKHLCLSESDVFPASHIVHLVEPSLDA